MIRRLRAAAAALALASTPLAAQSFAFRGRAAAVREARATVRPHEVLSAREYEVLCMIGSGKSVREIADELRLSPKTISTHRARMLRKMRLKTSADLIRYVVQHGLTALVAFLFWVSLSTL